MIIKFSLPFRIYFDGQAVKPGCLGEVFFKHFDEILHFTLTKIGKVVEAEFLRDVRLVLVNGFDADEERAGDHPGFFRR